MHIKTIVTAERKTAEVLVVPMFLGQKMVGGLPAALRTKVLARLRALDFKGEWGAAELLAVSGKTQFIGIVGLGARTATPARQAEGMRRGVGKVIADARRHTLRVVALDVRDLEDAAPVLAAAAVEAVELISYRFTDYLPRLQREQAIRGLKQFFIITSKDALSTVRAAVKAAQNVLPGVELARQMVNQPASVLTPASLVSMARQIAKESQDVSLKVLNRQQAEKAGFSAFLAVAKGSLEEPYVIHLQYRPKNVSKKIFIIGKGITFDSGGLSIKPAEMMELMKIDMAGAASVLGLFSVLPKLGVNVEVHGLIAACENMPSGHAYRPGDVLRAKNGKTIEVANTDAEGRITLADALSYAVEHKPDAIVDVATLTGAAMVALGETVAALFGNRADLRNALMQAAEVTGEGLCALPLPDEYKQFNRSPVADVRNVATSKFGGAITAALFLQEFVDDVPWAHVDIAAPSYLERSCLPYYGSGATGYGVRLLARYLQGISNN